MRHIAMRNAHKQRERQEKGLKGQNTSGSVSLDGSIVRHIAMTLRRHTFGADDERKCEDFNVDDEQLPTCRDEDNRDDEYYDESESCDEIVELDVPAQVDYEDEYYFEDGTTLPMRDIVSVIGYD